MALPYLADRARRPRGHFRYALHFLLLSGLTLLLYVGNAWQWPGNRRFAFAFYGALHAAALVMTLRINTEILRKVGFIALAGVASQLTFALGIESRRWLENVADFNGPLLLVGLYAFGGALVYGVMTRVFWVNTLTHADILGIGVGCLLASLLAVTAGRHFLLLSGWWLAAAWWLAFSAGLRCVDRDEA